jgi:alpha-1,2-glucosyltransferase
MVALCLTLLPAHLLEPRYFTTPLILASLEMPHPRPSASLLATILGFIAVNVVTIYIFLYRPFVWNDGSTARFMW